MNINLQSKNNRIFAQNENCETIAEITFPMVSNNIVDISRTFVHSSLRGQGIADKLMQAVVDEIRPNGFRVIASCSYAKQWFSNHPEYGDMLDDW